ncbi:MAG: DUF998 domain-containing protein [Promethearchaeota archaeon]
MFQSIRESINKVRKRFYEKIVDLIFVKTCTIAVIAAYIPLLIIGHVIAAFLGPNGYSIWTHWISDLGGSDHTPAPFLYDLACIIAGVLTIPFTFYMEKLLAPIPKKKKDLGKISRLRLRLGSYAFLFSIIGNIGYIGVGIFSEDRNYLNLHSYTSALAFGGFTLGAFFMGALIILYDIKIPKLIGVYGMVGPLLTIIIFLIINNPLWEWLLLFSILAWIIPLSLVVFHNSE